MYLKIKKYSVCSFALLTIALLAGGAEAKVTGNCSNCHTMHNSQNGTAMAKQLNSTFTSFQTDAAPNPMLLISDCVGCHTYADNTTTITATNIPIVFNTAGYPSASLAGGNFYGVSGDNSTKHNVAGLTAAQSLAPPGFKALGTTDRPTGFTTSGSGWGPTSWTAGTQVTCAGTNGCHGDRSTGYDDYKAVRGAHHANNMAVAKDGSTVAKSYRFLAGIMGSEISNYERQDQVSSTSHNAYYGVTNFSSKQTISYLCGECHGNFHGASNLGGSAQVGTQSPWFRHPTDVALVASGGSPFTTNYTTYDPNIPVAFSTNNTANTTTSTVGSGSNIIMCLSCHRAHGSPYYKLMRWNIKGTTLLSSPTPNPATDALYGCSKCHKGKD